MSWNYFHNNHNGWFYAYGLANEGVSFFVMLLLLRSRKSIFTMITLCDLIFLWWFWCLGVIKLFSHKSHLVILPIWTCKWMCFIFLWCFYCLDVVKLFSYLLIFNNFGLAHCHQVSVSRQSHCHQGTHWYYCTVSIWFKPRSLGLKCWCDISTWWFK